MSTASPRLPAHLPPAATVLRCPACLAWQLEYPHEPGIAAVLDAVIAAHVDECPGTLAGQANALRRAVEAALVAPLARLVDRLTSHR